MLNRTFNESRVIASYSKVAWFYNFWSSLTESKTARQVIQMAEIKDGESVLEVAVGTGRLFADMVARNKNGINEGIDISPNMLNRAKKLLKNNQSEFCRLQLASAYKLPFEANSFDVLINSFMFDLLPEEDFVVVLSEFYRVLKTPGRVVISTMSTGSSWYHKFWYWISRYFPSLLTGCRPVSLDFYLGKVKFSNIEKLSISQNSFPSEIIMGKKL